VIVDTARMRHRPLKMAFTFIPIAGLRLFAMVSILATSFTFAPIQINFDPASGFTCLSYVLADDGGDDGGSGGDDGSSGGDDGSSGGDDGSSGGDDGSAGGDDSGHGGGSEEDSNYSGKSDDDGSAGGDSDDGQATGGVGFSGLR